MLNESSLKDSKKIKLLFVHYMLTFGGAETALYDLVKLLDKKIFDITIFSIFQGGQREEDFKNIGVRVVNPYSRLISKKNLFGKIYNVLTSKRIENAIKNDSPSLISLCLKESYDIVISYHNEGYCDLASMPRNSKTVKYVHCDALTNEHYKYVTNYIKTLKRPYDKIICVSEYAKESFIKEYSIKENIISAFNPIDSENIINLSKETLNLPFIGNYYCAVGRLGKEKGFGRLITIQKRIIDLGYKINLVIVGEGEERKKIEELIKENKLNECVFLVGYQDNPYPYIKNSLFTVVSSYSEGLSLVAMESICLGIPVVGCFPTIKEIFGGFHCGVVTLNDDDSLYDGILSLVSDNRLYLRCLNETKKRSSFFDGQEMVKRIEKEYLKLLQ